MMVVVIVILPSFCVVCQIPRRVVRVKSVEWWGEAKTPHAS
jgi:ribosomal protein S26